MSRFRKICRWLHREAGFLAVGLTLAYAVSGVAVNHIDSWNPNHEEIIVTRQLAPVGPGPTDQVAAAVLAQLDLPEPVQQIWRASPEQLRIIFDSTTIDVDLTSGQAVQRGLRERPFLHDANFLHLNHGKGIWTWIADGYAVVLALLALTGIFLVRGGQGLAGRGGVLMAVGVVLPVVYLISAKYM